MAYKSIPFVREMDSQKNNIINESPQILKDVLIQDDETLLKRHGLEDIGASFSDGPVSNVQYVTTIGSNIVCIADGKFYKYEKASNNFKYVRDYLLTYSETKLREVGSYSEILNNGIVSINDAIVTLGFGEYKQIYTTTGINHVSQVYSYYKNTYTQDSVLSSSEEDEIQEDNWIYSSGGSVSIIERDISPAIYKFSDSQYLEIIPETFSQTPSTELSRNNVNIINNDGSLAYSFTRNSTSTSGTVVHAKNGVGAMVTALNDRLYLTIFTDTDNNTQEILSSYSSISEAPHPKAVCVTDNTIVVAYTVRGSVDEIYYKRFDFFGAEIFDWTLYGGFNNGAELDAVSMAIGATDSDVVFYYNTRQPINRQCVYALTNFEYVNGKWLGLFASTNDGKTGATSINGNVFTIMTGYYNKDTGNIESQAIISTNETLEKITYTRFIKLMNLQISDNGDVLLSYQSANTTVIKRISSNDYNKVSDSILFTGTRIFFGANPAVYDGSSIVDVPFRQTPKIKGVTSNTAGGLAAESVYYIATYYYKDAAGNAYESKLSPALSYSSPIRYSNNIEVINTNIKNFSTIDTLQKSDYTIRIYKAAPASGAEPALTNYRLCASALANSEISTTIIQDTTMLADIQENEQPFSASGIDMGPIPSSNGGTFFDNSVFLIDSDQRNTIRFSSQYSVGTGLHFPPENTLVIEGNQTRDAETITAIAGMDSRLLMFKKNSILQIYGTNGNYTEPEILSTDIGCVNQRSIIVTSLGVFFMSAKGMQLVTRQGEIVSVSSGARAYDSNITAAIQLGEGSNIIFFTDTDTSPVFNTKYKMWTYLTNHKTKSAAFYDGGFIFANGSTVSKMLSQSLDYGQFFPFNIDTGWLKASGVAGYQRFKKFQVTGEFIDAHGISIDSYHDYEKYKTHTYTYTPYSTGYNRTDMPANLYNGENDGVYRFDIHIARQKGEAIRFIFSDTDTGSTEKSAKLISYDIIIDAKRGLNKIGAK